MAITILFEVSKQTLIRQLKINRNLVELAFYDSWVFKCAAVFRRNLGKLCTVSHADACMIDFTKRAVTIQFWLPRPPCNTFRRACMGRNLFLEIKPQSKTGEGNTENTKRIL